VRVTPQTKKVTRQRILEVAKKQFAEQGFEATTTRNIACGAQIAVGTLFNYFPTKESIALCLVSEAWGRASEAFADSVTASTESELQSSLGDTDQPLALEEELFGHVAAILRKLKPYRKCLPAVLESSLSPLALEQNSDQPSLRVLHLETVSQIIGKHGQHNTLSTVALQLYWTLYTGVLAFWANDRSPRQEDTLALLDQSLAMFVGWLTSQPDHVRNDSQTKEG
jgi:AcrR family transcriptional regulator